MADEDTLVLEGASYIDVADSDDEQLMKAAAEVERKLTEESLSRKATSHNTPAGSNQFSGQCHGLKRKKSSHDLSPPPSRSDKHQQYKEQKSSHDEIPQLSHSERVQKYKEDKFQEFLQGYKAASPESEEKFQKYRATQRPFKEFLARRHLAHYASSAESRGSAGPSSGSSRGERRQST